MIHAEGALIGPGEVTFSAKWVSLQTSQAFLAAATRYMALSIHPFHLECHCGDGPSFDSIEEFEEAAVQAAIDRASTERKRLLIQQRRREFQCLHPHLELALIERDGYVCSHPGCGAIRDLQIDHVVPLSRGGTDELTNLCFLCRWHNGVKGDRRGGEGE